MLLMALLWFLNGMAGFILFALITIYHFGQADIEQLNLPVSLKKVITVSCVLMILFLVIFVDISSTFPVIEQATGVGLQETKWLYNNSYLLGLLPGLHHPILMLHLTFHFRERLKSSWRYPILESMVILFLFAFNDPIIGFSIYFALWHSI